MLAGVKLLDITRFVFVCFYNSVAILGFCLNVLKVYLNPETKIFQPTSGRFVLSSQLLETDKESYIFCKISRCFL